MKKVGGIVFNSASQPGAQSRFGNFAFNEFFGNLATRPAGADMPKKSSFAYQVLPPENQYNSRQIDQVIPSRAYKRGKTP